MLSFYEEQHSLFFSRIAQQKQDRKMHVYSYAFIAISSPISYGKEMKNKSLLNVTKHVYVEYIFSEKQMYFYFFIHTNFSKSGDNRPGATG